MLECHAEADRAAQGTTARNVGAGPAQACRATKATAPGTQAGRAGQTPAGTGPGVHPGEGSRTPTCAGQAAAVLADHRAATEVAAAARGPGCRSHCGSFRKSAGGGQQLQKVTNPLKAPGTGGGMCGITAGEAGSS
ncbi:hypothetical protein GCM10011576_41400 [Micromonospora parathelypteridis]|nr:hypothetical protein GCM10011576_41400 [Micromonospora parathelypteridis]